jgi:lipoprotein-anchoring transpeptidase ErfK/SrfK
MPMIDFYSVLSRAVAGLDDNTPQARRALYDRARSMLAHEIRSKGLSTPRDPVSAEQQSSLEAAIARLEREAGDARAQPAGRPAVARRPVGIGGDDPEPWSPARPLLSRRMVAVLGTTAVLLIGVVGAVYLVGSNAKDPNVPADPASRPVRGILAGFVEDLEPGTDGGSSEANLPYAYRRQPIYYRTTHPVGTVIIDKSQRFIYVVQPNQVALRYGIGIGRACVDAGGLQRVARKEEWPEWRSADEPGARQPTGPKVLPGAPGNPLGARVLHLAEAGYRIHGTNAPETVGHTTAFGCFRLVNDAVTDLDKRASLGARVVIEN